LFFSAAILFWQIFTKFKPEKYDFNLYKAFFKDKKTQIRQILKEKKSKSPIF